MLEDEEFIQYRSIILGMAQDIIQICGEHGLKYALGGGSALGAIRHSGFIPWDDDFDILMPRQDYEKLIQILEETRSEQYWLHTPQKTADYGMLFLQIRKKGTVACGRDEFSEDERGICLDVFPIENTFDFKPLRLFHGMVSLFLCFVVSCNKFYRHQDHILKFALGSKELEKTIKKKALLGKCFSFLSLTSWAKLTDGWHCIIKSNKTKMVTVPSGRKHYFGEIYYRDAFIETDIAEFEGHHWNVPRDIEGYLTQLYGNYMQIPPEDEREKHVFLKVEFPKS